MPSDLPSVCPKCGESMSAKWSDRSGTIARYGCDSEWFSWKDFYQTNLCRITCLTRSLAEVTEERKQEHDLLTEALDCSPGQTMNFLIAMAAAKTGNVKKLTEERDGLRGTVYDLTAKLREPNPARDMVRECNESLAAKDEVIDGLKRKLEEIRIHQHYPETIRAIIERSESRA